MIGLAADSDASLAAMQRISGGRAEAMTAGQVIALADQGDEVAAGVVAIALEALAVALANVTALSQPEVVILGGPLLAGGDGFLAQLRDRVIEVTTPFARPPALRWGALEPVAALLGAVHLAATAAEST
jgi:glucokinase